MIDALGARAIAEFGEAEGAQIIELARAFMPAPAARPPSRRRPIFVPVAKSDAEKAGGAEIIRRTIAAVAAGRRSGASTPRPPASSPR